MNIDFVVTWLDANDPEWREQYHRYRGEGHKEDKGRFRNWDFFKYWFRAVENYAPWVNKVFLVTNGKNPDWINPNHPKLVLVKHSDYMPAKYLPSFNSRAIELNFHRIEGLSECFVYFNDDFYINGPVCPDYYFKGGLPCDYNFERFSVNPFYSPEEKFRNRLAVYCDIAVLNYHFDRWQTIRQAPLKWFGPHLWNKNFLACLILYGRHHFRAFALRHNEQPMLKSVIQEIWDKEPYMCEQTCSQFRNDHSLNPYIIRYWQFASNLFYPIKQNAKMSRYFGLGESNLDTIKTTLQNQNIKSVCLNDTARCDDVNYSIYKQEIHHMFQKKFPQKSSFEL